MKILYFKIAIAALFLFYIGGCIASASFDISNWDKETRMVVSSFWVLVTILAIGNAEMDSDIKNRSNEK